MIAPEPPDTSGWAALKSDITSLIGPAVIRSRSFSMSCAEHDIKSGSAPIKLVLFAKKNPRLSHEEYRRYWRDHHGNLVKSLPGFCDRVAGYVQHYVEPGSLARFDGEQHHDAFDGMMQMWFERLDDIAEAFDTMEYRTILHPDERISSGAASPSPRSATRIAGVFISRQPALLPALCARRQARLCRDYCGMASVAPRGASVRRYTPGMRARAPFGRGGLLPALKRAGERIHFLEAKPERDVCEIEVIAVAELLRGSVSDLVQQVTIDRAELAEPTLEHSWARCPWNGG